jgi:molecular chaperone DnaJ
MNNPDLYAILGVERNADADTIKKAFRKMAMKYHPDKNPGDAAAEEKFKEVSMAYDVLSDPEKRQRYDRFGMQGVAGGGGGGGGFHANDINDIFSHFSSMFEGSGFEDVFGRGRQQARRGSKGSDLRVKLKLTLEEIATGIQKKVKINRFVSCTSCSGTGAADANSYQACPTCKGTGEVRHQVGGGFFTQVVVQACPTCQGEGKIITKACATCNGEGRVSAEDTVSISVPGGVSDGVQLSMRGSGHAGRRGGPSGDLIVQFEELPHEHFQRNGLDIIYELNISLADAALGASLAVPTLDGKVPIKIEPGLQSGSIKRLKGKGLPSLNTHERGSQLVYVNVWTPKQLTAEERKILEKLRKSENFNPNPVKGERTFLERIKEFFV